MRNMSRLPTPETIGDQSFTIVEINNFSGFAYLVIELSNGAKTVVFYVYPPEQSTLVNRLVYEESVLCSHPKG